MAVNWGRLKLFSFRRTKPDDLREGRRPFGTASGIYITEDTAMKVSALYRGVMYIATQVAKLPWYIKDKQNNIQDDSVAKLLSLAPNEEMSTFQWRVQMIINAIIHGNSFSEIVRNNIGTALAMYPLDSKRVSLYRDPNRKLWYKVEGGALDGTDAYLDLKNVFHICNLHTIDGLWGLSLIAFARDTIGISAAADRMASGIFANGGMPSVVLKHKGSLSDAAYARLKDSWKSDYKGSKSGGTALLEEDTQIETLELDAEALQFLESRKFGVLELARFLGIPPTKLFDVTAATYSNVENSNLEVATDTLDSWIVNIELQADIKILNYRYNGKYSEIDISQVFRGDMAARADYYNKLMNLAALSPKEIREMEGKPAYPGSERFYITNNNFVPVDRQDEVIDANIESKKNPKTSSGEGNTENKTKEDKDVQRALNKAALRVLEKE